jgi:type II secretory pathway pseudopilin PulG
MEIMVVIGIATVILAIGIPRYVRYNARMRLQGAADRLAEAMKQTRALAMRNGDGQSYARSLDLTNGVTSSHFAVYPVQGGTMAASPVLEGDLAYIPASTVEIQMGGMPASTGPAPPPPLVGAIIDIGGQRLAFGQDGSVLNSDQNPKTYDFTDGQSTFQVSISSSGSVTEREVSGH